LKLTPASVRDDLSPPFDFLNFDFANEDFYFVYSLLFLDYPSIDDALL